jgi:hypothetical protein
MDETQSGNPYLQPFADRGLFFVGNDSNGSYKNDRKHFHFYWEFCIIQSVRKPFSRQQLDMGQ